jgi:hypothetical protein
VGGGPSPARAPPRRGGRPPDRLIHRPTLVLRHGRAKRLRIASLEGTGALLELLERVNAGRLATA